MVDFRLRLNSRSLPIGFCSNAGFSSSPFEMRIVETSTDSSDETDEGSVVWRELSLFEYGGSRLCGASEEAAETVET